MKPIYLLLVLAFALSSGCATPPASPADVTATNHDDFDLDCVRDAGSDRMSLHVEIDAYGQFSVTTLGAHAHELDDVRTYTNAVTWVDGGDRWTLDRFSRTLKSKGGLTFICTRRGGRQF